MSEDIRLNGKKITVKELTAEQAEPVDRVALSSLEDLLNDYNRWGDSTFELTINNPELFMKLLSLSTGKKMKFLKRLKAEDYDMLMIVFLSVNASFFLQRIKLANAA